MAFFYHINHSKKCVEIVAGNEIAYLRHPFLERILLDNPTKFQIQDHQLLQLDLEEFDTTMHHVKT